MRYADKLDADGKRTECLHEEEYLKQYTFNVEQGYIECLACKRCGTVEAEWIIPPPDVHSGIPWGNEERL